MRLQKGGMNIFEGKKLAKEEQKRKIGGKDN
jgi:hypothetical protein